MTERRRTKFIKLKLNGVEEDGSGGGGNRARKRRKSEKKSKTQNE